MNIIDLNVANAEKACALWNRYAGKEFPHKPMDQALFNEKFLMDDQYVGSVAMVGDEVVGFCGGNLQADGVRGFITTVLVDDPYRRQGVGEALLADVEEKLKALSNGALKRLEFTFFNPATLEWFIPNTEAHDHPNAPGVDIASPLYTFLQNRGYRNVAHENSYYLPLDQYEYPQDIQNRLAKLAEKGITITFYDSKKHYGMQELVDDLGNDMWKRDVMGEINRPDGGRPMLIAEEKGKIIGFTGPLDVQPSGRGFFLGIGIHSQYRGVGAGKCLFAALCKGLQGIGAGFMTLFTGEDNLARNIYEAAGFRVVKSWVIMRKEVK